MRKKGSTFILERERNEDILRIYRELTKKQLSLYGRICHSKLLECVVNSQATRYWVSPERASSIIYKMKKGMSFNGMKKNTIKFYKSLYNDYELYKSFHPKMSDRAIVEEVLLQPAPCFLLTPRVAGDIIFKMKKQCRQQTIRNLKCS